MYLFLGILFFSFQVSSQEPLLYHNSAVFLGRQFPAATGKKEASQLMLSHNSTTFFETQRQRTQLYFDTPTQSDRWGWGATLLIEKGVYEKLQRVGWALSHRLPLSEDSDLYLGSSVSFKYLSFITHTMNFVQRPDPLLETENSGLWRFNTGFLYQLQDYYAAFSMDNWGIRMQPLATHLGDSSSAYWMLFGYENSRSQNYFQTQLGSVFSKQSPRFFHRTIFGLQQGSRVGIHWGIPWYWQLQWIQSFRQNWEFSVHYGNAPSQLHKKTVGISLLYLLQRDFVPQKPVESIDYK